jgi:hypothetical protein
MRHSNRSFAQRYPQILWMFLFMLQRTAGAAQNQLSILIDKRFIVF